MQDTEALAHLDILYEDNHLIVVNKKPGEIVQGDKTGDIPLSEKIKVYLKEKYNKPGNVFVGVVHRLDRPVSGAVIFARTSKALARMNELIKKRQVNKRYWAVVKDMPESASGSLVHFLKKNQKKNKSFAVAENEKGALRAELDYHFLAVSKSYSLLEVILHTGRHHQIRVQMSAIHAPIKGDVKYGFKRLNQNGRMIHLHARLLEFIHPVKKTPLRIKADPPEDKLWQVFNDIMRLKETEKQKKDALD